MKRVIQMALVLSLAAMCVVSPVLAATSQGLEWGITVSDEFTYQFRFVDEGETTLDEGVNASVNSLGGIADPISDWFGLPSANIEMVYTNGTPLGLEAITLIGILGFGGAFALPTGNWTFMTELAQDSLWWTDNHTVVNDGSVWGSRLAETEDDITSEAYVHYLKSDGLLARYVVQATNSTSGVSSSISLVRNNIGFDIVSWVSDNILVVGIGVGVIVVLGAVVCRRR
ncbi:hypothetical protein EU524_00570 [Candidatus Thorarchaeota archaeon]|jgi:hypothetical protein|nr:MAG: hypothetical protein EU524_00570 [Candidatus Thorarchaeota archaeon]